MTYSHATAPDTGSVYRAHSECIMRKAFAATTKWNEGNDEIESEFRSNDNLTCCYHVPRAMLTNAHARILSHNDQ